MIDAEYSMSARGREVRRGIMARHREAHAERNYARYVIQNAIRREGLKPPSRCEICGQCPGHERLHAHHDDYGRPREVRWLCRSCHQVAHGKSPIVHRRSA